MLYEKILTVAGTSFRQDAIQQAKASSCTHAYLKHEPNNCFDPMAHQVFINGIHVGYVPKQEILGLVDTHCRLDCFCGGTEAKPTIGIRIVVNAVMERPEEVDCYDMIMQHAELAQYP